jgi:hypothetical protein
MIYTEKGTSKKEAITMTKKEKEIILKSLKGWKALGAHPMERAQAYKTYCAIEGLAFRLGITQEEIDAAVKKEA